MKNLARFKSISVLMIALMLIWSCNLFDDEITGTAPTADAGLNIDAAVGSTVTLDGSNSSDAEGPIASYSWALTSTPSGSSATISNANSEVASFTPDVEGTYTATLTVEDEDGNTAEDEVLINVQANIGNPPTATITDENGVEISANNGNNTVNVNSTVAFSAAQSFDPDGDELSFEWTITDQPDGSTVQLTDETTNLVQFSTDTEGSYTLSLTVSDNNGNENTAEVVIMAEITPVIIDSNVDGETTWSNVYDDPSVSDYRVVNNIALNALLTIDPGVTIEFDEDVNLYVANTGAIIANGTVDSKIIFTSSDETSEILWKGIEIASTSARNSITHAEIRYAGGDIYGSFANFVDVPAAIAIHTDGKLALENTTVTNSGGYGMYLRYGELTSFLSNTFTNNNNAGVGIDLTQATALDNATVFTDNAAAVEIYGSTIAATNEASLADLNGDSRYYVSGNLAIQSFLGVNAGASFDMAEDVNIHIQSGGVLSAIGAADSKIEFTSASSNSGILWKGFEFSSADSRNELTHTIISYAGNSVYGSFANFVDVEANIAMHSGARLTITNSEISNGGGYGIYNRYGEFVNFGSNTFAQNTFAHVGVYADAVGSIDAASTFSGSSYAVEVYGGNDGLSQDATWVKLSGTSRYNIVSDITVTGGLTISPGAILEFDEDVDIDVRDTGFFIAEGTATDPITFTSSNEAGQIAWGGLKFYTSDARNALDFATINLAGGNVTGDLDNFVDEKTAVAGNGNARITITNSTISNSEGYGVYFQGTINDIESAGANNTFTNNPSGNVY